MGTAVAYDSWEDQELHCTDEELVQFDPCAVADRHVAALVHHGKFEDFTQGHAALLEWIDGNRYKITGPYREIYLKPQEGQLEDSTTEIQFPVEKI